LDLYGIIRITSKEARLGTRKMISVPQGLRKRTLVVTIPPGVQEGTQIRLRGLGKQGNSGERGDLFLDVHLID
jgi:DnaJ-class molecular chaperone